MLKIISGAQTGVDRGALNAALASQTPCGGWCPADRRAEDGIIAPHYPVTPLLGAGYRKRTRQNVIDSDATVIIYHTQIQLSSGTALTLKTCLEKHKPRPLQKSLSSQQPKPKHRFSAVGEKEFCKGLRWFEK